MKWKNFSPACLSGAAIIAIAFTPRGSTKNPSVASIETASTVLASHPIVPRSSSVPAESLMDLNKIRTGSVGEKWVDALQGDELAGQPVFENLATYEPLVQILKKGIISFERRTLRSPNYQEEEGYDVVVYEIRHPLSTVSRVMAYVSDEDQAVKLLILSGRPGDSDADLVQFDGHALSSQKHAEWSEAQELFDRQLTDASTLMNASVQ